MVLSNSLGQTGIEDGFNLVRLSYAVKNWSVSLGGGIDWSQDSCTKRIRVYAIIWIALVACKVHKGLLSFVVVSPSVEDAQAT